MPGAKTKSVKQVRFLFSKVSPLTPQQKDKLETELRTKVVREIADKTPAPRK